MTFPTSSFRPNRGPALTAGARRIVLSVIAIGFLAIVVIPWLAGFATDWLWYNEIHFQSVFLKSLVSRGLLFVIAGLVAFAFLYGNVRWARRGATGVPALYLNRGDGVPVDVSHLVPRLLLIGALVVSFVIALIASAQWMSVLMAMHAVPVGQADPLFGRDIGFYLFRLPAISAALTLLVVITVLSFVAAAAPRSTRAPDGTSAHCSRCSSSSSPSNSGLSTPRHSSIRRRARS